MNMKPTTAIWLVFALCLLLVLAAMGWLSATALLGLMFLSGQAYEFTKLFGEGLTLSSNVGGATFFTLTGFHGMHVLGGVIWIGFVLARAVHGS